MKILINSYYYRLVCARHDAICFISIILLIVTIALGGRYYYDSYYIDEESQAQRLRTHLSSHSCQVGFECRSLSKA